MPDLPEPGSQWICTVPGEDYLRVYWATVIPAPLEPVVHLVPQFGGDHIATRAEWLHRDFTPAGAITLDWLAGMPGWVVETMEPAYFPIFPDNEYDGLFWTPEEGLLLSCGTHERSLNCPDRLTLLWAVRLFRGART